MSILDEVLEPVTVADIVVDEDCRAYKMDRTNNGKDLRVESGLGACHCCDYFLLKGDRIILIEETRLTDKAKTRREKYNLESNDGALNKIVRDEIQLKVYGAILVLCRLAAKCDDVKELLGDRKYRFWLVTSAVETADDKIYSDSIKDFLFVNLPGSLQGALGGKRVLDEVAVVSSDDLRDKLSS